jgi:hypothetical protein
MDVSRASGGELSGVKVATVIEIKACTDSGTEEVRRTVTGERRARD